MMGCLLFIPKTNWVLGMDYWLVCVFFPVSWFTPVFHKKLALTVTGLHFNNETVLKVNV